MQKKNRRIIKALIKLRFQNLMTFRLGFFGPFFVDGSLFFVQLLVFQAIYSNIDRIGTWGRGEMILFIGTFSFINAVNVIVWFFGINNLPDKIKDGQLDLMSVCRKYCSDIWIYDTIDLEKRQKHYNSASF